MRALVGLWSWALRKFCKASAKNVFEADTLD